MNNKISKETILFKLFNYFSNNIIILINILEIKIKNSINIYNKNPNLT